MPEVVPKRYGLGQVLVERERPGHRASDPRRLERVREPGAVVVALGRDEDLRLVLETPERLGVDDAVAVALERRPQRRVLLRDRVGGPVARRARRMDKGAGRWGDRLPAGR